MLRHLYDIEILATVLDHTMYKMQIVIDFIENRGGFDKNDGPTIQRVPKQKISPWPAT